jgi:sec-independent protein translocase protein TatA
VNISKELIIILVIALIIFGPSRLAGLGGAVGKMIRDFRKSMDEPEGDKAQAQPSPTDSSARRP